MSRMDAQSCLQLRAGLLWVSFEGERLNLSDDQSTEATSHHPYHKETHLQEGLLLMKNGP